MSKIIDLRSLLPYDWDAIAGDSEENQSRDRRPRRLAVVWLRRGDRGAHMQMSF